MNWAAAETELKAWFARVSGIHPGFVTFEGEAVGMRETPWAELKLTPSERPQPGDEVRLAAIEGDDEALAVEVVGNRGARLTCRVRNRSQKPNERAQAILDRVRTRLESPSSQEAFEAAGLALREGFGITEMPVVSDMREESEAVLDLAFNYAVSSLDEGEAETVPKLAGVRYSGVARSGSAQIAVPETSIPEETAP